MISLCIGKMVHYIVGDCIFNIYCAWQWLRPDISCRYQFPFVKESKCPEQCLNIPRNNCCLLFCHLLRSTACESFWHVIKGTLWITPRHPVYPIINSTYLLITVQPHCHYCTVATHSQICVLKFELISVVRQCGERSWPSFEIWFRTQSYVRHIHHPGPVCVCVCVCMCVRTHCI